MAVDPSSVLQSGGTVTVDWNDSNVGDAPASGSWYDQVTVVNTTTGQTMASASVTRSSSGGSLAAGQAEAHDYTFALPSGPAGYGQLSITVTADAGNNLLDYNSNGTLDTNRSATITAESALGLYPDLHATTVAVDPSSVLQSSGTVTIDWDDGNVGSGPTSGSWYDQVTVVNTTTGQTMANASVTRSSSGSLAAGQSEARQFTFTLPNGPAGVGQLSITVTADAGDSQGDYNSNGTPDTNRSASITAQSTLAAYPDLQVTGLAASPASGLLSGQTLTVNWSDSNTGSGQDQRARTTTT